MLLRLVRRLIRVLAPIQLGLEQLQPMEPLLRLPSELSPLRNQVFLAGLKPHPLEGRIQPLATETLLPDNPLELLEGLEPLQGRLEGG